jgi:two-component system cell cycle sensor histidine kinase/response regulator CckA
MAVHPAPHTESVLPAVVDHAPVAMALVDREGRVTRCNAAAAELLGRAVEDLRGADPWTALRPQVRAVITEALTGARESVSYDGPLLDRPPPGGEAPAFASVRAWPTRDADGATSGALLMVVDLGSHRLAEDVMDALRESEKRYRELVELSPEPIFVHADRRILYANPAARRAFGVGDSHSIVGRPIADFIHPDAATAVHERLTRLESGQGVSTTEQRFRRADGSAGDAEVASIPLEFEGRHAVLTVARDITERKRAELQALASEQRLRAQFKAIPVPTYAWQRVQRDGGDEFVLVDHNDAAVAITAGNIARLVGITLTELYGDHPLIREDIHRCLREHATLHRDMQYTLKSTGQVKHLSVTYLPAGPDVVLCYTEDLSERLRLEEHLRHAQKMEAVGRLAGGVAHDFNNLLMVIQSFAEGLARDLGPEHPQREDVEEIRKASTRAAVLTRSLLAFSRKQVLMPRSIDLRGVLADLEPMLRRIVGEDVVTRVVAAAPLPPVHADPGQIEQVIVNLVANARDAMPSGGVLTLEAAPADGDYVRLSVTDTGHGMDEATQRHIFEPFFTTKALGEGTGLGLATVHGIVAQSGGSVRVTSAPGAGTTFEVLLPRARDGAVRRATEPPPSRSRPGGGESILLVEDETAVRTATRRILERAGYAVTEAADGRAAIAVAEGMTRPIELLLTDVLMPGLTGPQLHRQLEAARPGLRVLYVSGYTDDEMLHRGMLLPGAAFLQKPFFGRALLEKVRAVLDGVAPEDAKIA